MTREPGYGELLGRIDDLEAEVDSMRKAFLVGIVIAVVLWFDLRNGKGGKDAD